MSLLMRKVVAPSPSEQTMTLLLTPHPWGLCPSPCSGCQSMAHWRHCSTPALGAPVQPHSGQVTFPQVGQIQENQSVLYPEQEASMSWPHLPLRFLPAAETSDSYICTFLYLFSLSFLLFLLLLLNPSFWSFGNVKVRWAWSLLNWMGC